MLFTLIKTFFVFVFYNTMQKQVVTKMNYKPPRLLMCDKKKGFLWHYAEGTNPTDGISQKCRSSPLFMCRLSSVTCQTGGVTVAPVSASWYVSLALQ